MTEVEEDKEEKEECKCVSIFIYRFFSNSPIKLFESLFLQKYLIRYIKLVSD